MPKKFCSAPGCNNTIDIRDRWCATHKSTEAMNRKHYNANRADDPHTKFIRSDRWKRIRKIKLQLNPVCELCAVNDAEMVDHCYERSDGGSPDAMGNLVSCCNPCHSSKTRAVRKARLNGTLDAWYKEHCGGSTNGDELCVC